jgi:hypothetical protein
MFRLLISFILLFDFLLSITSKIQGMPSQSSSSASGDHNIATAGSNLTSINRTEPAHLHNVDIYIWEISYQSAIVLHRDVSSPFVTSATSPSTTDSGISSQPQQSHQSPTEDTNHHRSVPPTTPVIIDPELSISPAGEVLPAHNQGTRYVI